MHTFSPAKMWIAGLTDLRKPLVHLHTQYNRDLPWAEIDMDFMNLHQSAHGDREFAFIQTRLRRGRKTVVGHWQDPVVADRLGGWARAAAGWHEAHRLRIARFGDNMREVAVTDGDKVEAQARLGFSVNGYGVSDLRPAWPRSSATPTSTALVEAVRGAVRRRPGPSPRRAIDTPSCARPRGSRPASAAFLEDGGFGAFTDTFEDLGRLEQLPGIGVQRLMADGYGFGAEGDWKAAALVRILKVMARGAPGRDLVHGGLHLPPRRSGPRGPRGPHARGLPIDHARPAVVRDPSAVDRRSGGPGPARLRRRARRARVVGLADLGDRFRLLVNEVDLVAARRAAAEAPGRPGRLAARSPTSTTAAEAWLTAGGPHHTALTSSLATEPLADFADMANLELRRDRREHDGPRRSSGSSAGTTPTTSSTVASETGVGPLARQRRAAVRRPRPRASPR